MNPAYLSFFILVCLAFQTMEGRIVAGKVLLQEEEVKPLANVDINIQFSDSSYTIATDEHGHFSIDIPNLEQLAYINLGLKDTIYQFSYSADRVIICEENIPEEIILYVQTSYSLKKEKQRYVDRMHKSIHRTYLNKLDSLIERSDASLSVSESIFKEHEIAIKLTPYLVERLMHLPIQSMPIEFQQAHEAFLIGDISDAKKLLKTADVEDNLRKFYDMHGRGVAYESDEWEEFNGIVEQYLLLATFYVLELNFREAEKYFSQALYASPEDVDHVLIFARFFQFVHEPDRAISFLEQALEMYKCKDLAYANVKNGLGDILTQNLLLKQAKEVYAEVDAILNELGIGAVQHIQFSRAQSLSLASDSLIIQNKFSEAKDLLNNSLELIQPLADQYPGTFKTFLAKLYAARGDLYRKMPAPDLAKLDYEQAISLLREMIIYNPEIYLPYSVRWNQTLANMYMDQQQFDKAMSVVKAAQLSVKKLLFRFPRMYQSAQSKNYMILAGVHHSEQNLTEAIYNYSKALDQLRQLGMQHPEMYRNDLQVLYLKIGKAYTKLHKQKEAQQALSNAYELINYKGVETAPMLLNIQFTLVDLYISEANLSEAEQVLNKAEEIFHTYSDNDSIQLFSARLAYSWGIFFLHKRELYKGEVQFKKALVKMKSHANPNSFGFHDLANHIHRALGKIYLSLSRDSMAYNHFRYVADYLEKVAPYQEKPFKFEQAAMWMNLAEVELNRGNFLEVSSLLQRAKSILDLLDKPFYPFHQREIARHAFLNGELAMKLHNFDEAEQYFNKARKIQLDLVGLYQREYLLTFIHTLLRLSELLLVTSEYQNVNLDITKAEEYLTLLVEEDEIAYRRELGLLYTLKGAGIRLKNPSLASEYFDTSIQIFKELVAEVPEAYQFDLAKAYYQSSFIEMEAQRWDSALIPLQQSRKIMMEMLKEEKLTNQELLLHNLERISFCLLNLEEDSLVTVYINAGLTIDSAFVPLKTLQAHTYILKDQFRKAEKIYTNLSDQLYDNNPALNLAMQALEELEKNGIKHKDFKKARKLLIVLLNQL